MQLGVLAKDETAGEVQSVKNVSGQVVKDFDELLESLIFDSSNKKHVFCSSIHNYIHAVFL